MRYAVLLLLVPVLLTTACSQFMTRSGEKLHIETRDDAIALFGPPTAEGVTDGKPYQEFRSRRKYAEDFRGQTDIWPISMTCGLAEFYYFPREVWFAAKRSVFGGRLRVTYHPDGSISSISTHGQPLDGYWGRSDGKKPATPLAKPTSDELTPTVRKLLDTRH